ncbi:hypothetical protein BDZ89DRAFT_480978 [Hymenopellis radicata]|nr:hypothetical protein BDZ89DRAFT_480978 [Hymenopellis radicata]
MSISGNAPLHIHTLSMDAQSQAQSLALFEALQHLRLSTYFDVSATALYVFDYLLTLEQEVDLIWGSKWTITKLLYLVTRYSTFVTAGVFLWTDVTPNMSAENCLVVYKMDGWLATAGVVLAEVILTLRTWAVWNRHRFLTVCMPVLFLAHFVAVFTVMGIFLSSIQFLILPLPDLKGCLVSAANPIFRWDFITSMMYEGVMLLLMVAKSYQQFREAREISSSRLLNVILKDGVMYYLYLSVLNITNIIVISSVAPDLLSLLGLLIRIIHAMLACRVITNIRAQAKKQVIRGSQGTIGDLGSSVGTVAFAAYDSTGSPE